LCGELSKEVKNKGLHMGFYYSLLEWYHPWMYSHTDKYIDEHMIPQMKDLVTRYEPDMFWTDGEWDFPSEKYKSVQFLSWLFNESVVKDKIVINDRWGNETRSKHGGFYTTEYDLVISGAGLKDANAKPWEECRGIGYSFGYNKMEKLDDYSSTKQLIDILIQKVAAGGNLLLNIGPTSDGLIPVVMEQRLTEIGDWLKVNGEAIYGTRKWMDAPVAKQEQSIYFTRKGNNLYAIVTKWQDKSIVIEGIGNPQSVSMLGYVGKVKFSVSGDKLIIIPPVITPKTTPCQYSWVFRLKNAL
jgi:alpha-L-fucosidase